MFDAILQDPDLCGLRRAFCCENGVAAELDPQLLDHERGAHPDRVAILKLDHYYATPRFHNPPPSVDCLIIVRCCEANEYHMYLVELRNTQRGSLVRQKDIRRKFETIFEDFFVKYQHVFFSPGIDVTRLRLYLVTNPRRAMDDDEYRRLMKGTVLDAYGSMQPLVFQGRPLLIEPVMPNPAISVC